MLGARGLSAHRLLVILVELRAGETDGRIRRKALPAATAADAAPTSMPTRKAAMKASANPSSRGQPGDARHRAVEPGRRADMVRVNP